MERLKTLLDLGRRFLFEIDPGSGDIGTKRSRVASLGLVLPILSLSPT